MRTIKKAVIVAAGASTRLKSLGYPYPKGLIEVAGEPMLARSVRLLRENGIEKIIIVVGYKRHYIQDVFGDRCRYIHNPFYNETNNMASLWFARDWVDNEPFIYLHSDLVYDPSILASFLDADYNDAALLVDLGPTDEEAMKVRLDNGKFIESKKEIPLEESAGEWVGISGFQRPSILFNKIDDLLADRQFKAYDTLAFTEMAEEGSEFFIVPTEGKNWIEIDFPSDLQRAKELFS